MFLRASAVRTSRRLDARRAPSNPTRRTCRTGSHATTSRDQNLILAMAGSLRVCLPKTFGIPWNSGSQWRHSNEAEEDGDDQKGNLVVPSRCLYCLQWTMIFAGRNEMWRRIWIACSLERCGRVEEDEMCCCELRRSRLRRLWLEKKKLCGGVAYLPGWRPRTHPPVRHAKS